MESDKWQEESAAVRRLLVSAPRTATEQRERHCSREMKGLDPIPAPGIPVAAHNPSAAGATRTENPMSDRTTGS